MYVNYTFGAFCIRLKSQSVKILNTKYAIQEKY